LLAVALPAPARAADPTVLVAARRGDSAIVRVTMEARVARVEVLIPGTSSVGLAPIQANGNAVSYVSATETEGVPHVDVGTLDAQSGAHRLLSRDGHSLFLLVARDGTRYVLRGDKYNVSRAVVRTDARGAHPRTLITASGDAWLSVPALSPDGRTLYVARTTNDQPSVLYAIDTATRRTHVVRPDVRMRQLFHFVVSPDGKTLAVSYLDDDYVNHVALLPLASGPLREFLYDYGTMAASAFTPDGSGVVLTATGPYYTAEPTVLPEISIGYVDSGLVVPVPGTGGLYQAVPVR
jgi:Tol biopolymer transport system component